MNLAQSLPVFLVPQRIESRGTAQGRQKKVFKILTTILSFLCRSPLPLSCARQAAARRAGGPFQVRIIIILFSIITRSVNVGKPPGDGTGCINSPGAFLLTLPRGSAFTADRPSGCCRILRNGPSHAEAPAAPPPAPPLFSGGSRCRRDRCTSWSSRVCAR